MTYTPLIALALAAESPAITTVHCGINAGTAFWISADRIITAAHVTSGGPCIVDGHPVRTIRVDHAKDVAELSGAGNDTWLEVDCDGFTPRSQYLAVGYPGGRRHSATIRATRARHDFGGVRRLTWFIGYVYRGMSGGPLLEAQGQVAGLISSIGQSSSLGESSRDSFHRPLSETFVCERNDQ